jgi:hypothetical protein
MPNPHQKANGQSRRHLTRLRIAYATGEISALREAIHICWEHNRPLPGWAYIALLALLDPGKQEHLANIGQLRQAASPPEGVYSPEEGQGWVIDAPQPSGAVRAS